MWKFLEHAAFERTIDHKDFFDEFVLPYAHPSVLYYVAPQFS